MSNYADLVQTLKFLLTHKFAPKPQYTRGLLGDGAGNVKVPGAGKEDKVYVRFNRSATEAFEIFNKEVEPINDWPVLIGEFPWQPGLTQVVGTDWAAYEQVGWGGGSEGVKLHAGTHEWPEGSPGSDPMNIYLRSIVPGKAYPLGSGSHTIYVSRFLYEYNLTGTSWPGVPGIDLSPATPPTGTQRYMGIYHIPSTNTLGIVTGSSTIFTEAIDPDRPKFPAAVHPAAWVRLYGGQQTITERDIRDARRLWTATAVPHGPAGGDLTGSYPDPRVVSLNTFPILGFPPNQNDVLLFTGSAWRPSALSSGGSGGNVWPAPNRFNIGATEYTTLALAIAAANSGETIYAGVGTHTQASIPVLPDGVNLVGVDRDNTIITTSSVDTALEIGDGCYVANLTITNTQSAVSNTRGVHIQANDSATIQNCIISGDNQNASGNTKGIRIESGTGVIVLIDCDVTCTGHASQTARYAISDGGATSTTIKRGSYNGQDGDIESFGTVTIYDPILETEVTDGSGDVLGWYFDTSGNHKSIAVVGQRPKLFQNRDYYVNASTGSDSNDGLTSGAPFATLQKAADVIGGLDTDIYDVTVNVANGTYTTVQTKSYVGAGSVTWTGDTATPSNVHINVSGSANAIEAFHTAGDITFEGFQITGVSGISIFVLGGSGNRTRYNNLDFAASGFHILASEATQVINMGNYSITGGAAAHLLIQNNAQYVQGASATITLTGTPAFSSRFAWARDVGIITASGATYSGAATGQRYFSDTNSDINTGGGGASFFPGNAAGATANGGVYV